MRKWGSTISPRQDAVQTLSKDLGISSLLSTLLIQRGYDTGFAARHFLSPELSHLQTPFSLAGVSEAVERLRLAVRKNECVGILGDYDVDGITSTALLVLALEKMGLDVIYRLPERLTEGYGVSQAALSDLIQRGANLIITVDCGISSAKEIKWAQEQGLDIIVCDHHLPPPVVPTACCIINPKMKPNQHQFDDLAGAAVAMKLAWALHDGLDESWLELAALGTVADVVPLIGENRVIVAKGLKSMANSDIVGLRALCDVANVDRNFLKAGSIGFRLAPRLNAAGRLGNANIAVQLLLTKDETEAYELAIELDMINKRRQQIENQVLLEAESQVEQNTDLVNDKALVVASEGWHPGVIGIVASRLVDKWNRPALVISLSGDEGKGSGRSIGAFSLYEALSASQSHLKSFGGHRLAAGFTVSKDQLTNFKQSFVKKANSVLSHRDCIKSLRIDTEAKMDQFNINLVQELESLSPFGFGNPEPILLVSNLHAKNARQIGNQGVHLRVNLNQNGRMLSAVGFDLGHMATRLNDGNHIDVLCRLAENDWTGLPRVELRLVDIRTATCPVEICYRPSGQNTPEIVDRRGQENPNGFINNQDDLVLRRPPKKLRALKKELSTVDSGRRIVLQYNQKEVAATRESVVNEFLDRDFLVSAYLVLKQNADKSMTLNSFAQNFGLSNENMVRKLSWAISIFDELNLIENQMHDDENHFRLATTAGNNKVDLETSLTFAQLQEKKRKALSLVDFFGSAGTAILAEAIVGFWGKVQAIGTKRSDMLD